MGGDLTGTSQPGSGAVFTLTLPLPPAAQGFAPPQEPRRAVMPESLPEVEDATAATEAGPGALRILLADDHATNREVVRLILESAGVELIAVEDGAQSVEAFKQQTFDAVLMDIQMPVMDGLTAVRLMRDHEQRTGMRRTPILVLSANVMPEHIDGSAAAGADDHIAKPVVAPVLLEALDKALTASENTAEIPAAQNRL